MNDDEDVCKFLDTEALLAGKIQDVAFQRKYLCRPKEAPNNLVGSRDGESLLRRQGRSDVDLLVEAQNQYSKSTRVYAGAAVAVVQNIRSLRSANHPDQQLFYIYEDPNEPQPHHAVIRYTDAAGLKTFYGLAREQLKAAFQIIKTNDEK